VVQSHTRSPHILIALIFSIFVFFGLSVGATGVLWAEILPVLGMDDALFGTLSLISPFTSIFILLFGSPFIERVGKRPMTSVGLLITGAAPFVLSLASTPVHFALVNVLYGLGYGIVEISVNSVTLDWEREQQKSVMNYVHAAFCAGAIIAGVGVGQLLSIAMSYTAILQMVTGIAIIIAVVNMFMHYPASHIDVETETNAGAALKLLISNPVVLTLSIVSFAATFGESVAITWSVLHLRDLGASAFIGGIGFAVFNTIMFIGRMTNNSIVTRYGVVRSFIISAIAITTAGVILVVTQNLWLAVIAFAIMGFGVAGGVPTALTAGAQFVPGQNSNLSGALMSVNYFSFVLSPPLIGYIAIATTRQAALAVVIVIGLLMLVFARRLAYVTQKHA
jgi:MFS family permease